MAQSRFGRGASALPSRPFSPPAYLTNLRRAFRHRVLPDAQCRADSSPFGADGVGKLSPACRLIRRLAGANALGRRASCSFRGPVISRPRPPRRPSAARCGEEAPCRDGLARRLVGDAAGPQGEGRGTDLDATPGRLQALAVGAVCPSGQGPASSSSTPGRPQLGRSKLIHRIHCQRFAGPAFSTPCSSPATPTAPSRRSSLDLRAALADSRRLLAHRARR